MEFSRRSPWPTKKIKGGEGMNKVARSFVAVMICTVLGFTLAGQVVEKSMLNGIGETKLSFDIFWWKGNRMGGEPPSMSY